MSDTVDAAIEVLSRSGRTRVSTEPLTSTWGGLSVRDAYAIQLGVQRLRLAEGRVIKGYKIGLTSRAMQRQMGVAEPDYGYLLDDMFYPEHTPVPVDRFIQPRVEPEIAFVLRSPLQGPGLTHADVIRAVDFVLPALEIIDSRIRDWRIKLVDTIADNASSGAVVLGSRPAPFGPEDLRLAGVVLRRNGEVVGTGAGGAVLGSPLNALAWLANTLGSLGVVLDAGNVVLSGSCTAAVPVSGGDTVSVTVAGVGSATTHFSDDGGSTVTEGGEPVTGGGAR